MPTVWTSLLLGSVPLYTTDWRQPVFSALTISSVLYHDSLNRPAAYRWLPVKGIEWADKALARGAGLGSIWEAAQVPWQVPTDADMALFWFCCWWIVCVYYVLGYSHLPGEAWKPWHASLHAAAALASALLADAQRVAVL